MSAAFGIIFTAIPGILLSLFAGSLGDILKEKRILALLDFIKGLTTFLLINSHNLTKIYIIMTVLSSLDAIYNPPRRKIITGMLGKDDLIAANSLLTGISGAAYIIGPLLAGFTSDAGGTNAAFLINTLAYFMSAVLILLIHTDGRQSSRKKKLRTFRDIFAFILDGINYCKHMKPAVELVITSAILSLCAISINIAFYPYAFDVIQITGKGWGVMMSIFYGTNLVATAAVLSLQKYINKSPRHFIYIPLVVVSAVWFFYGNTSSLLFVLILQFLEGSILAFCSVIILTQLQTMPARVFLARIIGISDIMNNTGKIIAIASTYIALHFYSPGIVFAANSVILFLFSIYKTMYAFIKQQNVKF